MKRKIIPGAAGVTILAIGGTPGKAHEPPNRVKQAPFPGCRPGARRRPAWEISALARTAEKPSDFADRPLRSKMPPYFRAKGDARRGIEAGARRRAAFVAS